MLAVERANMDIALFSLIVTSHSAVACVPGPARVAGPILVLLGATAKIYPVFALPAFLFTRSRVAARTALALRRGVCRLRRLQSPRHRARR